MVLNGILYYSSKVLPIKRIGGKYLSTRYEVNPSFINFYYYCYD